MFSKLGRGQLRFLIFLSVTSLLILFQNCGSGFNSTAIQSNEQASLGGGGNVGPLNPSNPYVPVVPVDPASPISPTGPYDTNLYKPVLGFSQIYALQNKICSINPAGDVSCLCAMEMREGSTTPSCLFKGQLVNVNLPFKVKQMTDICYLATDGRVFCQGYNYQGEAGVDPAQANYVINPTQVNLGEVATTIVRAYNTSCALLQSGVVKCWGQKKEVRPPNNGTPEISHVPWTVQGISAAKGLYATTFTNQFCAWLTNNQVSCWGEKAPQMANSSWAPEVVYEASDIKMIMPGLGENFCILSTTKSLSCYKSVGANNRYILEVYQGLNDVVSITSHHATKCIQNSNGDVYCWGINMFGRVGFVYKHFAPVTTPTLIPEWKNAVSFSAGMYGTCAVMPDSSARCLGYLNSGFKDLDREWTSGSVMGLSEPIMDGYSTDYGGTCVRGQSGQTYCHTPLYQHYDFSVPSNQFARIGNEYVNRFVVAYIPLVSQMVVYNNYFSDTDLRINVCYIDAGKVKCSGDNRYGQLGNGTTNPSIAAVEVSNLTQVVKIKNYDNTFCALTSQNRLYCWGYNMSVLFNGLNVTGEAVMSPLEITSVGTIKDFDLSYSSLHVLGTNGDLKYLSSYTDPSFAAYNQTGVRSIHFPSMTIVMNDNSVRQYTYNTEQPENSNFRVISNVTGTEATEIVMVASAACVIDANRNLKCWGENAYGNLGQGDRAKYAGAVVNKYLTNVTKTANVFSYRGYGCALVDEALGAQSKVMCWGDTYDYSPTVGLGLFEIKELRGYRPILAKNNIVRAFKGPNGEFKTSDVARVPAVPYMLLQYK